MIINVKMPTIVGILTFMSRMNFVLSGKISFITHSLIPSDSLAFKCFKLSLLNLHLNIVI